MVHVHLRILRLAGSVQWWVAAGAAIGLLVTGTYVAQGVLIATVLGRVFAGADLAAVTLPLVGVVAAVALRAGLLWVREITAHLTAHRVKARVRGRVYDQLLTLGPGYLVRHRTGDLKTLAVDGVEKLENYFGRYLPTVVVCLVGPVAILTYLATIDLVLAGLMAVFAVAVPLGPRLWDKLTAERGAKRWEAYSQLSADYVDALQGMTTLKAANAVERFGRELVGRARHLYDTTMRQLGIALFDTGLTALLTLGGAAVALGVGALRVAAGDLDPVGLFVVLLVSREIFRPFSELSNYWHVGFEGLASSATISDLLVAEPEVTEPTTPAEVSRDDLTPRLELDDVTFAYGTRDRPALSGVSLHVDPGETVAVVGRSGSGKTTIVSLLLRFFDPQQGAVRVGGHDVRSLPLATVRSAFGVVSQDTYLFAGSIADNIRLARPDADIADVIAAARDAQIHDDIVALPDRYDTYVGERGLSVSGGQRQRIAIARALLADAPILVLDEATSNIDADSEAAIQQSLERVTAQRTTLVIAHRLSTIRDADRIVVLEGGVVTEQGRHSNLVARRGDYAQLVAIQEAT